MKETAVKKAINCFKLVSLPVRSIIMKKERGINIIRYCILLFMLKLVSAFNAVIITIDTPIAIMIR